MARPKSPPRVNGPYPDRGGTRFRVRIFDQGQRKDLYFRTRQDAIDCIAEARRGLSTTRSRLIGAMLDEYFAEKERRGRARSNTCAEQRERVRWFLRDFLDVKLEALTPARAAALYEDVVRRPSAKTGKPMAAASHRHYLALAKGFFSWAARAGLIDRSPFQDVQPIGRAAAGKPQLRIEEARLFVEEALRRFDDRGDVLALGSAVALLMGLRAGELLRRCARDVDRGGEILWIDFGKTRNARRFLDVPAVLRPRLLKLSRQLPPDALLFGAGRDGLPRVRQLLWQAVHRICDAAAVPRVCPHSLRGLWATLGVQTGAMPQAIAAALGHGSFAMTEKHYAQPEAIRSAHTTRMLEALTLSADESHAATHRTAEQLLRELPREVLDTLVLLHRESGSGGAR